MKGTKNYPPVRSTRQLGASLKRLRNEMSFSQAELAKRTNLRQAGISLLENGSKGVRLETLFKILAALELEIVIRPRKAKATGTGK